MPTASPTNATETPSSSPTATPTTVVPTNVPSEYPTVSTVAQDSVLKQNLPIILGIVIPVLAIVLVLLVFYCRSVNKLEKEMEEQQRKVVAAKQHASSLYVARESQLLREKNAAELVNPDQVTMSVSS